LWYGTTKRFLQVFGVRELDQLPLADQLRRSPTTIAAASRQKVAAD
jgi:chromosome segregation and condensation protein ScpB